MPWDDEKETIQEDNTTVVVSTQKVIEVKKTQSFQQALDDMQETILIYGLPKHGKTFAYCSFIEEVVKKGGNVYILSTDGGFIRTFNAYFGDKSNEIYAHINMKLVYDINSIRKTYNEIKKDLKPNDLLVIDLISDVWEWAQIAFTEEVSGGDIQKFIINAMKDKTSFGLFDSNKWNYVKALHKFVDDIIVRKPCNFIGVCDEKETSVEQLKGKEKAKQLIEDLGFDELTTRPGGMKLLPYKFSTIVRIGISGDKYFMQVVGDRGFKTNTRKHSYEKNMYEKLKEIRKSVKPQ